MLRNRDAAAGSSRYDALVEHEAIQVSASNDSPVRRALSPPTKGFVFRRRIAAGRQPELARAIAAQRFGATGAVNGEPSLMARFSTTSTLPSTRRRLKDPPSRAAAQWFAAEIEAEDASVRQLADRFTSVEISLKSVSLRRRLGPIRTKRFRARDLFEKLNRKCCA